MAGGWWVQEQNGDKQNGAMSKTAGIMPHEVELPVLFWVCEKEDITRQLLLLILPGILIPEGPGMSKFKEQELRGREMGS